MLPAEEFESLLASLKREAGLAPGELSPDGSPLSSEEILGIAPVKAEKAESKSPEKAVKAKRKARPVKVPTDDEFHDCLSGSDF